MILFFILQSPIASRENYFFENILISVKIVVKRPFWGLNNENKNTLI